MALESAPAIVSIITQFFFLCSIAHKKKNWLFSSTVDGVNASALVYTMVEMARAHDLNIYGYLQYLLERHPDQSWTDEQLADLVPWSEKLQYLKN